MVVVGHTRRCCDTVEVLAESNHYLGYGAVGCKAVAEAQKNLDWKDIEMWIFVLVMEARDRPVFLLG